MRLQNGADVRANERSVQHTTTTATSATSVQQHDANSKMKDYARWEVAYNPVNP